MTTMVRVPRSDQFSTMNTRYVAEKYITGTFAHLWKPVLPTIMETT